MGIYARAKVLNNKLFNYETVKKISEMVFYSKFQELYMVSFWNYSSSLWRVKILLKGKYQRGTYLRLEEINYWSIVQKLELYSRIVWLVKWSKTANCCEKSYRRFESCTIRQKRIKRIIIIRFAHVI